PWVGIFQTPDYITAVSIAWSGNWIFRFEPLDNATYPTYRLSAGLNDWNFSKTLRPGESMESPHVIFYEVSENLNDIAQRYTRFGRQYLYPHNPLADSLPVEWNHWWSYEDADINETVFLANVEAAQKLGVELCTLDAGWFGSGLHWGQIRGDWEIVNRERFPHGVRYLADAVHAAGMKFGLWCEIEGLGAQAALNQQHPDFPALRDGQPLGYVCFGNPDAQEWAYQTLSRLIRDYDCDWIKLDFNVDPGAGCNRVDHGHGAGDGLFEHVQGYYRVLDRIRAEFPEVVLENCSSGGLRVDLGMMRHTHVTFLSDPDWPVHALQVFWGATTMLAPNVCIRWSFSEWRPGNGPSEQHFNPRDPALQPHQLDYYTRIAMLGLFGMSQKLPDLPIWVAERLAYHIDVYKQQVRRFVREADLYRLTDQPHRDGTGDRWCAFQYSLADEHLLFVFRLPGAEPIRSIRLLNLTPARTYQIETLDGGEARIVSGRDLMGVGITFTEIQEEGSVLVKIVEQRE
ncbi:MAG TPA: alpha-galactosidase, partial [Phototrophicaceae bacterium]|nr:alpha-galactosidase [Phototrophicaceae bacterium]